MPYGMTTAGNDLDSIFDYFADFTDFILNGFFWLFKKVKYYMISIT